MLEMIKKFWKDESGLETVEYAVAAALVITVAIGTWAALGTAIQTKIEGLTAHINGS